MAGSGDWLVGRADVLLARLSDHGLSTSLLRPES